MISEEENYISGYIEYPKIDDKIAQFTRSNMFIVALVANAYALFCQTFRFFLSDAAITAFSILYIIIILSLHFRLRDKHSGLLKEYAAQYKNDSSFFQSKLPTWKTPLPNGGFIYLRRADEMEDRCFPINYTYDKIFIGTKGFTISEDDIFRKLSLMGYFVTAVKSKYNKCLWISGERQEPSKKRVLINRLKIFALYVLVFSTFIMPLVWAVKNSPLLWKVIIISLNTLFGGY